MVNLLTCPRAEFIQEIKKISDINELKNILWALEEEKNKIQKQKEQNNGITYREAIESKGEEEVRRQIKKLPEGIEIGKKVKFCREYLLMIQLRENLFSDKLKRVSEVPNFLSKESLRNFSWGILQRKEPQKVFEAIWKYRANNREVDGKLQVSDCGKFLWQDERGISIDELESNFKKSYISVPTEIGAEGKTVYNVNDIRLALKEKESHRGELELIRVSVGAQEQKRQEDSIDYLMLMQLDQGLNWNSPEVQNFFAQTYLSTTFKELVDNLTKKEECIYGGKIMRNQSGKLEVNFDEHKEAQAVAKANRTLGTTRTDLGVRKEKLGRMVNGIQDIICAKEKIYNESRRILAELENIQKPTEGR